MPITLAAFVNAHAVSMHSTLNGSFSSRHYISCLATIFSSSSAVIALLSLSHEHYHTSVYSLLFAESLCWHSPSHVRHIKETQFKHRLHQLQQCYDVSICLSRRIIEYLPCIPSSGCICYPIDTLMARTNQPWSVSSRISTPSSTCF